MTHDFRRFPELTNSQMDVYYFESPHRQITEDFSAKVVKVMDGDTIELRWQDRDFDFPLRFSNIAAPEKTGTEGKESSNWLESKVLNKEVEISINPVNRVGKFGRLLGAVQLGGLDVGDESILAGHSVPWDRRKDGEIPNFQEELEEIGNN
jgi:endonuclease YncB( thermonuclease family)|tara:strand:- start:5341 stop:5793 length:453 start_codon:yes stop_codon:yes gene_type:complete